MPELVAMLAIGLFAGLATGMIENVAKTGWVKVVAGLIAGKQFILYRNPTFLGSGPDCQIYLFKDPQVGRRHAAIHIIPGGFELEDLPLGEPTYVNGKPVNRPASATATASRSAPPPWSSRKRPPRRREVIQDSPRRPRRPRRRKCEWRLRIGNGIKGERYSLFPLTLPF